MKRVLIAMLTAAFCLGPARAEAPAKVDKMVACAGIQDGRPDGEAKEFDSSYKRVYCWMRITAPNPPVSLKLTWYANGQKISEAPFQINASPWVTWRYKSVWLGRWKAEVSDASGTALASMEFLVKKAVPKPSHAAPQ